MIGQHDISIDQVTPEIIRGTVVRLVESLSQMVMDCVKGDIQERVKSHCTKLVAATNELIGYAKVTAADDPALVKAITKGIKDTHSCVGRFIDAFVRLTRTPHDQQVNGTFSKECKDFADIVIQLTDIIDPTSSPRMVLIMRKAVMDLSDVEKLCAVDWPAKDPITTGCKQFELSSKLVILNATMALNISVSENRRVLFDQALDLLEESAVKFLDNARKFSKDPHDPLNPDFQRNVQESGQDFGAGLSKLIQAIQEPEISVFQKFFAAIEYIQVLIVKAKKLAKASLILNHSTSKLHKWNQIADLVTLTEGMIQQTMEVTKAVMDKEPDPAKRGLLEGCIWDFEDVTADFKTATDAYCQQPNEETSRRISEVCQMIVRITKKITTGVDDSSLQDGYVNLGAIALTDLGDIADNSSLLAEEDAFSFAMASGTIGDEGAVPGIIDQIIYDTFDEDRKRFFTRNRGHIIDVGVRLLKSQKDVHLAPSASLLAEVDETRAALQELIGEEHMILFEVEDTLMTKEESAKVGRAQRDPLPDYFTPSPTDKAILGPPKEQIQAAYNLLRECDKVAFTQNNDDLKIALDKFYPQLLEVFECLLDSANQCVADPGDSDALTEMRNQQKSLNLLATQMALSSAPNMDPEVMAELQATSNNSDTTKGITAVRQCFTGFAQVRDILASMLHDDRRTANMDVVSNDMANTVVVAVKNMAANLKLLASMCLTPDLRLIRKACLDAATQCIDSSMRMKILIRGVVSSGEDPANKISSATFSYLQILDEVKGHIDTFLQKDNIRQTHAQTQVLQKIVSEVRRNRGLKV